MMTREELLEALLVERYTPIPPHRVLPAAALPDRPPSMPQEVRDRLPAAERIVAERIGSGDPPASLTPWTTKEIRFVTERRRDGGYVMSARQCAARLQRTVAGVEYVRGKALQRDAEAA